jgi:cytochrome c peroxidase
MQLLLNFVLWTFTVVLSSQALGQGALPSVAPAPKDNPQTAAKISLGKQLYFDPRLSSSGAVSCASCHNIMAGGEDNRAFSVGVEGKLGGRSSPTVWNAAFFSVLFWDGRAASLEEQAKGPLTNPLEMGMKNHDEVMARVAKIPGYVSQFKAVFGGTSPVTIDNLAKAIASFERTLVSGNSPYDQYVRGNHNALSASAKRGLKAVEETGCLTCHSGPHFSGPSLPPGLGFYQKFPVFPGSNYDKAYELAKDEGRFQATKVETDKNMWRVPTWRNVALTAPYFHNGSVKTLEEAVRVMAKTQLNKDLNDTQLKDMVAFLKSLTGKFPKQQMPTLPPTLAMTLIE